MESEFSPDKTLHTPPVPIKTYQWEDLRRAREAGCYPWTHLLKPPLEGEVTAEDILRESTPRRSMSREISRSRTQSPDNQDIQQILDLDSSPGSSRRHGEEGEDEGIQIPKFSKEVSLDSDDDPINNAIKTYAGKQQDNSQLAAPLDIPKNVSPKSILKRRTPEPQFVAVTETREKTRCCHPLVNKIKHLADKTLHKLEKSDTDKSPIPKRKKNEIQEIRQLKSSPSSSRRQKFGAIKLGDSDEMSKSMCIDSTSPPRKRKEHIYEDIEESKNAKIHVENGQEEVIEKKTNLFDTTNSNENESLSEKKSNASQDPSLYTEDNTDLRSEEHVMEQLHKFSKNEREALLLDENEEPNIDEIFQNQLDEVEDKDGSPNITITEILDDETEDDEKKLAQPQTPISHCETIKEISSPSDEQDWSKPSRWTSEGGSPLEKPVQPTREGSVQSYTPDVRCACQFYRCDSLLPERLNPVGTRPTSRASNLISYPSDHEYEIIEKQPPHIVYTAPSVDEKPTIRNHNDDESSTTSLERKYLQHTSDEEDHLDNDISDEKTEEIMDAEILQKDIEDRYFVNTPSTVSRTECDVSTSQVDSSALENLPLKRGNRSKYVDSQDNKLQAKFKESTTKLKTQAGKLKTKLQNMKSKQFSMPDRPKIKLPDRPKFKMPDRPKISFPERSKFSLPERRKFSLPDRPKFKKINISEKLSLGDRKKFTFPERPKFNVPDLPKFKMPDRPRINFPSLSRKKGYKVDTETIESGTDLENVAPVEFEVKTYPRLFSRKKKPDPLTSSSPTLNRADTPPPIFTFTKVTKSQNPVASHRPDSPTEPREYGNIDTPTDFNNGINKRFNTTYDFDKLNDDYIIEDDIESKINNEKNTNSNIDISPSNQVYTHVINEINNDEFFVRPRGISRENIQVREYLSDEIRQAFKIPKNALALMGNSGDMNEPLYVNEAETDPELLLDENELLRYSTEDINEKDDGYYTFPPIRPNRAKRKKKELEAVKYIDDDLNASIEFTDVNLQDQNTISKTNSIERVESSNDINVSSQLNCGFDVINYNNDFSVQSQTLPAPPKRKKKNTKMRPSYASYTDVTKVSNSKLWEEPQEQVDEIVVYRTEHEYIIPNTGSIITQQSPLAPRRSRNRSRSSHGTSFCDDDRTSQGAESLTLDTQLPATEDIDIEREIRHESPGYATVDKSNILVKTGRQSKSKTPPVRRRKSHSSERKYYTVCTSKEPMPNKPPRKKSSTSLMTLDQDKRSINSEITQYVEIEEPQFDENHKDLKSGEIISKMKDRPLPPPPRPPRGPKRKKNSNETDDVIVADENCYIDSIALTKDNEVVEIEVSTQTDPLPDDVDFELGLDENLDISMSSSLRDIIDEEQQLISKSLTKLADSPRQSRPASSSEKSIKLSDPKISELSKANIGRTSPTVILIERRVSSPTRINEREEIVTEASLTVQHIDVDESIIPDVPPLPRTRGITNRLQNNKDIARTAEERALERVMDSGKDVQLDNLVTQRLQVKDLDVGRLNVSELQASKILVSDIEGMTLQVNELDSKSGHLSVSGIEFSQTIIDEIVKKFAELSTTNASTNLELIQTTESKRPVSREEETQTEESIPNEVIKEALGDSKVQDVDSQNPLTPPVPPPPPPSTGNVAEEVDRPPQRPPPPDLTPLLYSYLQDLSMPPTAFYHLRTPRERPFTEFHESQQSPPTTTRRTKRKPANQPPQSESSSDESRPRPSPRRVPSSVKLHHEPTIAEAGVQFFRVCQNSITRTLRNMFNNLISYISGTEDKKDVQMALVIFLVLIAGLIMFGLSDSRTIHHHHWEFFNPPDGNQ